ncbi:PREDICTED: 26S proteasome non-ATPase regulatory subunit 4-like [Acropora digitifera]|uniref:26S proteasome non-ATPase regulatory subunit 4-like n=1 Tax=Acropora digitifera TaxID=70779 RepID=UPI00077B18B7|nr:PREDICTED: 26S proteasome non-ATPase regulatory subunit 4-like [Acropora digitifera]
MVLESTVVCVDNSEWMRNGDFLPTRLQAQQDAVSLVCHSKTRQNPENNIGLMTLASLEVLVTLTSDVGKILASLHRVQSKGEINFLTAVKKAHLVLKHRQGKNHKMRIVVFVGSPVDADEKDLVKLAKKLKKEKVNIDIVNFGEDASNSEKLASFINALNGKDGNLCHLVTVPPGPLLSDALISSPIMQGEDGASPGMEYASEYAFDPNSDPELALALRVSMEEQRQRQEEEARRAAATSGEDTPTPQAAIPDNEEAMLQQALSMSTPQTPVFDFGAMTEDQQIEYAMRLSLQNLEAAETAESEKDLDKDKDEKEDAPGASAMETDAQGDDTEDITGVMADPDFIKNVLSTLPGVDPSSEAIQKVMVTLAQQDDEDGKDQDGDEQMRDESTRENNAKEKK